MVGTFLLWLLLLACLAAFLLSLWIVIPAPIFALLPLSVGTSEISPGLVLVNLILAIILVILIAFCHVKGWSVRIALTLMTIALLLTSLPLIQFGKTYQQADRTITQILGQNYLAQVPATVQAKFRSRPLILTDIFQGITTAEIRYTPDISFANPDNVALKLNLYRPAKVGHYPAIVTIYGGAWQRGNPDQDAAFNRYMAAQGYVVWAISYRHAPQYQFPAQIDDVRSALQFIQTHATEYETDIQRVGLMGRSAGAQLAMLAAYQSSPFPIQALVNYYGPVNLTAGYYEVPTPDPIGSRSVLKAFLGGTPEDVPTLYQQASPLNAVKPNLPPSLLIYGKRDHIVQSKYGRNLARTLAAQGNQVVFMEIPWADHAFDAVFPGVSNQLALYYTERFLAWALHDGY
jgi:acetyl esterase/lipase